MPEVITIEAAAAKLGVSRPTIERLAARGHFRILKLSVRCARVVADEFNAYVAGVLAAA